MAAAGDHGGDIAACVREAAASGTALRIRGGGSKPFLGRTVVGEALDVSGHRGIVAYEPTELVVTARAGTPLAELEAELAASGQMLAFEPPAYAAGATIGGTIACGLSGPRRPYAGAARDFVLGTRIVNGRAEVLAFGGQVMKNVAGYDLSRLMTGAMGTLGVLLDVSMKVLPKPAAETTLALPATAAEAIARANAWAASPLPLSAVAWLDGTLFLRLSGTAGGVASACARLAGSPCDDGEALWRSLREQQHAFFAGERALWRVSVPATHPPLVLEADTCIDWGGALRWLKTDAPAAEVRRVAEGAGGHATLFRAGAEAVDAPFHPLSAPLEGLHRRLKQALDPQGVLNPGCMYAGL